MNSLAPQAKTSSLLDIALFQERREHSYFDELRALNTPTFHPEQDGPGFYALTRYDHVWEAARNHKLFLSGHGTQIADKRAEGKGAPSVHNADSQMHRYLRDFGRRALAQPLLELRRERVQEIVRGIIAKAPRGEVFDFVEHVALTIPMTVFGEVLGVPELDREYLVEQANTMSSVVANEEEQSLARSNLFSYFRELAHDRRARPRDDVTTALVGPSKSGSELSEEELDAYFLLLVIAGNETTRFLLAGGLEQLLLQPSAMKQLRSDPRKLKTGIEEMVRWVTPVIHMRRTLAEDAEVFGLSAKAGTKFVLYFSAANRDPAFFDKPQEFRIDRWPNTHVGFGAGQHFCLGAYLARMETQIFFEEFFKHFSSCELAGDGQRIPSFWFAGLDKLPVHWS
ncbi:MAG: cytochrome P450 [Pseudomonadota bacterium]